MRKSTLFLSLILSVGSASTQLEVPSDSIRRAPSSNTKEFGGFLLDTELMNVAPPELPKFSLDAPDVSKDYNRIFRLSTDTNYTQGFTDAFFPSFSGFGHGCSWELSSSLQFMQMGIFELENGWKINTYGDYDRDGWKVPNRSAMLWKRNNFRGAFELKSSNGDFGIRVEAQQGQNGPY